MCRFSVLCLLAVAITSLIEAAGPPPASGHNVPPGVVIDHLPAAGGVYVGSPSIAILPDGGYVASHDFFGPRSSEQKSGLTAVFHSGDRGATWKKIAELRGQFWSTLFVHRGALYLLGTDKQHGNPVIRRSRDGGATWTTPNDAKSGLLRSDGQYHCGPMPVVEHAGRLWRAMERRNPPLGWGITYCAGMLSAPAEANLLDAAQWTFSNFLPSNKQWLAGSFGGWLEGNAVAGRDGRMWNVLRVESDYPERAAMVSVSPDGRTTSFDPRDGFVKFPGGAKKFTIRFDRSSDRYWALASIVPHDKQKAGRPGVVRNTLALTCSTDLVHWNTRRIVLEHPDSVKHAFQYVDWQFDGDDIAAVSRTAFDDVAGSAANYHDANYLTFHRVRRFRDEPKDGK